MILKFISLQYQTCVLIYNTYHNLKTNVGKQLKISN